MRADLDNAKRKQRTDETVAILQGFINSTGNRSVRRALIQAQKYVELGRSRTRQKRSKASIDRMNAHKAEARRAKNLAIGARAGNTAQQWTGKHDALVLSSPLPDAELALSIGRSLMAVRSRRAVLNQRRAAIPTQDATQ